MSHFGISTYIDGEGEDGGSSGTIQWWDKTYSDSGMYHNNQFLWRCSRFTP